MTKDPFRNRDYVADFDLLVEEYGTRSLESRETLKMERDIAYGDSPAEKLDLFFPGRSTGADPVHLFIHGGYWRMFSKDDFSFIADTVTAAGAIAAVMDYDLMPKVRLDTIVDQVQKAIRWLATHSASFGGDATRFSVSGHSAGAHLATFAISEDAGPPRPIGALLLSGIYDLLPLQSSFLQPLICLTDREVADSSPLSRRHKMGTRVTVAYGQHETDPFRNQASAFAQHLTRQGLVATTHMLAGANHMTAVRDLGNPQSAAGELLIRSIRGL